MIGKKLATTKMLQAFSVKCNNIRKENGIQGPATTSLR